MFMRGWGEWSPLCLGLRTVLQARGSFGPFRPETPKKLKKRVSWPRGVLDTSLSKLVKPQSVLSQRSQVRHCVAIMRVAIMCKLSSTPSQTFPISVEEFFADIEEDLNDYCSKHRLWKKDGEVLTCPLESCVAA